jgi:hypothetical protein
VPSDIDVTIKQFGSQPNGGLLPFSNREILWERAVVEDFAEYRAHFRQHQLMTDIERLFKNPRSLMRPVTRALSRASASKRDELATDVVDRGTGKTPRPFNSCVFTDMMQPFGAQLHLIPDGKSNYLI